MSTGKGRSDRAAALAAERRSWRLILPTAAVVLWASGCPAGDRPDPDELARVNGEPVTADDLRARWRQGPVTLRKRAMEQGGRHYLLDRTVDDALLEQEARRRRVRPTYEDRAEHRRRWVELFLQAEFEPTVSLEDVSEEELRAEYERLAPELGRPATARIELSYCKTRDQAAALADKALEAQERRDSHEIRKLLAAECEARDPRSGGRYGGVFAPGQAAEYLGEEVDRAAFSLEGDDRVYPEPVPYRDGWAVVVVPLRSPPDATSFEEAAPQLRHRVFERVRREALDRFVGSFRDEYRVDVDEDCLDLVPWDRPPPRPALPEGADGGGPRLPLPTEGDHPPLAPARDATPEG